MPRAWLGCWEGPQALLWMYFHFPSQIMALERCLWGHEPVVVDLS